jgi:hypothetical protein
MRSDLNGCRERKRSCERKPLTMPFGPLGAPNKVEGLTLAATLFMTPL